MNPWPVFRVVFSKELRELIRDRKTLFWLLAPPFILPGIAILAAVFIGTQTARYITQGFPVAVVNSQAAPDLMKTLKQSKALIVTELPDSSASTNALITLIIPDDFQQQLASEQPARLKLTQRDNTFVTTLAVGAVRSAIGTYSTSIFQQRLKNSGHDQAWLTPVITDETEAAASANSVTSSPASGGGSTNAGLGAIFLPLAVTSWLIGGGLGLVADTTVGEKDRQTIESLLVTPANRLGIVLGKLTVVFLVSFAVMGLWMLEGVFLSLFGEAGPKILAVQGASFSDVMTIVSQTGHNLFTLIAILLLLLIPFIVLLNSLVMVFCSFASSYRESNVFLFLLQLLLPAMVLLSIFSVGPDAGIGWYAAPILGTIVAIRDLFSQTLTSSGLLVGVLSATLYAMAGLAAASYTYSREWALARGI
jgi:sodium transport system permease protein